MATPSCSIRGIFCRFGLWSSSASYHQLQCSQLLSGKDVLQGSFSRRKRRPLVPVVTGRGRQVFFVDPHILEHWLFQDLLHKHWGSMHMEREDSMEWEHEQLFIDCARGKRRSAEQGGQLASPVCLDCDAILFEFFLWLVENDDPSLRDLNLGDLMEFYSAES